MSTINIKAIPSPSFEGEVPRVRRRRSVRGSFRASSTTPGRSSPIGRGQTIPYPVDLDVSTPGHRRAGTLPELPLRGGTWSPSWPTEVVVDARSVPSFKDVWPGRSSAPSLLGQLAHPGFPPSQRLGDHAGRRALGHPAQQHQADVVRQLRAVPEAGVLRRQGRLHRKRGCRAEHLPEDPRQALPPLQRRRCLPAAEGRDRGVRDGELRRPVRADGRNAVHLRHVHRHGCRAQRAAGRLQRLGPVRAGVQRRPIARTSRTGWGCRARTSISCGTPTSPP